MRMARGDRYFLARCPAAVGVGTRLSLRLNAGRSVDTSSAAGCRNPQTTVFTSVVDSAIQPRWKDPAGTVSKLANRRRRRTKKIVVCRFNTDGTPGYTLAADRQRRMRTECVQRDTEFSHDGRPTANILLSMTLAGRPSAHPESRDKRRLTRQTGGTQETTFAGRDGIVKLQAENPDGSTAGPSPLRLTTPETSTARSTE